MFAVSRVGDFVGLYVGMFLVPATLSQQKLGAVLPLMKFAAVVAVPMTIVARTAMKYISMLLVKEEHGKIKSMLRDLALLSSTVSVIIIVALWIGWDFIEKSLKIDDKRILWLLGASLIFSCWTPLATSVSQGLKHFYRIILARLLGPIARLLVAILLLKQLQVVGYLSANLSVGIVTLLLLGDGLLRYFRRDTPQESYKELLPDIKRYVVPIGIASLLLTVQLAAGPWFIRKSLSEEISAGYYIAAMFGNIPMWVAPAMLPFLFPLVSERYEKGISTRKMHIQALGIVLLAGLSIALFLFVYGENILALRPNWQKYSTYSPFMWQIALITTLDTFFQCHFTHETACKSFGFLRYYAPLVAVEIILLWVFMGWEHLSGIIPAGLYQSVHNAIPVSLQSVLIIMLAVRVVNFIFLLVSLWIPYITHINTTDRKYIR